jgi:hypothetical protein
MNISSAVKHLPNMNKAECLTHSTAKEADKVNINELFERSYQSTID